MRRDQRRRTDQRQREALDRDAVLAVEEEKLVAAQLEELEQRERRRTAQIRVPGERNGVARRRHGVPRDAQPLTAERRKVDRPVQRQLRERRGEVGRGETLLRLGAQPRGHVSRRVGERGTGEPGGDPAWLYQR